MRVIASDDLEPQVAAFGRTVAGLAQQRGTKPAADADGMWRTLSEAGWPLLGVPEASGGAGVDIRDLQEFVEQWARHLLPVPLTPTLLAYRWIAMAGVTLPGDGAAATIAVRADGGRGAMVPFSRWPGIVCFAGLEGGRPRSIDMREEEADDFAPSLPLGVSAATSSLSSGMVGELGALVTAEAVGIGRAVLATAIDHATQRTAYGQRIVEFQAIRHMLADMHRDVEIAKSASVWSAQSDGADHGAVLECLRLCRTVAEKAIQIHGGIGFTWDLGLHFYVRHLIALRRLVSGLDRQGLSSGRD